MSVSDYRFEVAISYASDNKQETVRSVAELLRDKLGKGKVFFAEWFEAELAGPDAQVVLQNYYGRLSRLVVVCVCQRYNDKSWTQEEWRAIQAFERQLRDGGTDNIKRMRFLPLRFGDGEIDGLFSTALVPDVRNRTPQVIADLILKRLDLCKNKSNASSNIPERSETPNDLESNAFSSNSDQTAVRPRRHRTNEFLHLFALIQRAIAPHGAKITESALVKAPGFGGLREIDVLLESQVGPFTMKVAFEANDHGRKLDVTDVETIIGKYKSIGGLTVDRVVLVSRHGFSNAATQKAGQNGIRLLTLRSPDKTSIWHGICA